LDRTGKEEVQKKKSKQKPHLAKPLKMKRDFSSSVDNRIASISFNSGITVSFYCM
jgi:hypothetical protein